MFCKEDIDRIRLGFKDSIKSDLKIDADLHTLIFLYLLNESKTQDTVDLFIRCCN